jgi:hypothetical protein
MQTEPFIWRPEVDQTFSGPTQPPLSKPASAFNKERGRSFTMNAPNQQLTLQVNEGGDTYWGFGRGSEAVVFDIQHGTFLFESSVGTGLTLGGDTTEDAILAVKNDASFLIRGAEIGIGSNGTLNIDLEGSGTLDINCSDVGFGITANNKVNIAISQAARMSVLCSDSFEPTYATVDVSSSPANGYSLSWISTNAEFTGMFLNSVLLEFSDASSGLFRTPMLNWIRSGLIVSDTARCFLQFDGAENAFGPQSQGGPPKSAFTLGPGTAQIQVDGYSPGRIPINFIENNNEGLKGMFGFETSREQPVNKGFFLIRAGSGFEANAIVTKGFVAIDGVIQRSLEHLNSVWDNKTGYATVTQTSPIS